MVVVTALFHCCQSNLTFLIVLGDSAYIPAIKIRNIGKMSICVHNEGTKQYFYCREVSQAHHCASLDQDVYIVVT